MKKATLFVVILAIAAVAFAGMELTSARVYRKQGDLAKALGFYDQAAVKEATNVDVYAERGEIYHDLAMDPTKIDLAKQVAKDEANYEVILLDRMLADFKEAVVSKKSGDDGAVKKNKKKIDQILQDTWNHFYFQAVQSDSSARAKASVDEAKPDYLAALGSLDMAIRINAERWNTYGFKAQIYTKLDSTALSAQNWKLALEKIASADPAKQKTEEYVTGAMVAREALMVDYYNLGQCQDVLAMSDLVLKDDATNVNAIQLKANCLARMTSDSALTDAQRDSLKRVAIAALESAEKSNPNDPDVKYILGQFHLQLGDTAAAVKSFNDVLLANPKDKDVMFVLGVMYLEGGTFKDNKKAIEIFKKLTEEFPDFAAAWTNYGIALIRSGDNIEGKKKIDHAKELNGK